MVCSIFSDMQDGLYSMLDGQVTRLPNLQDLKLSAIFQYRQQYLLLTSRDNSIWLYDLSNNSKKKVVSN